MRKITWIDNTLSALRRVTLVLLGTLLIAGPVVADAGMTVYKSPTCGCCKGWVQHMRDNGFEVQAVDVDNVMPYKQR